MTETPVVELLRVSTQGQATEDRQGLPAQRTINRETCARLGLQVIETVEIIESGATVATSADMERVLDMIQTGRVLGIVLAAYDRLFRPDRWTDFSVLQVIADQGAQIYVPSGPIDLQTELGFIQASVNNLMAGLERRRIRERTVRARDELRRQGKLASGSPPFGMGYDKAEGRWIYTDEIEQVKEIFRLYLSGEERSFARLGERFGKNPTVVQQILQRPAYAGWLIYLPRSKPRRRGVKRWPPIFPKTPDDAIRVQTGLPAAVAVEDFLEAQEIIQQRRERVSLTRGGTADEFLYRGMLACRCSLPIYGIMKRGRKGQPFYFYGCRSAKERVRTGCTNKHMVRDRVETALDGVMTDRLTDPKMIATAVESYNESLLSGWRASTPSGEVAQRRRADLERRRERILEAFFSGLTTRKACDEQVGLVDAQLHGLAPGKQASQPPALKTGDVLRVVRVFRRWPRLTWATRREILEATTPSFVLHRYRIEGVHLGIPVVQSEGASRRAPPGEPRS